MFWINVLIHSRVKKHFSLFYTGQEIMLFELCLESYAIMRLDRLVPPVLFRPSYL